MIPGPDFTEPGAHSPRLASLLKAGDVSRFISKVRQVGDCWEWQAYKDRKGYGQFWHAGMMRWAHRWSYALFIDEIPPGETVDHICHNPSCVCPAHLQVMSRVENTVKGNHRRCQQAGVEPPF